MIAKHSVNQDLSRVQRAIMHTFTRGRSIGYACMGSGAMTSWMGGGGPLAR